MKKVLSILFAIGLFSTGCAALQQMNQTANDINKTANDIENTANDIEKTSNDLNQTVDKVDKGLEKAGVEGMELENDEGEAQPAQPLGVNAASEPAPKASSNTNAHCCVNGAFYSCSSGLAAGQCLGEPMTLMECMGGCMDTSCEDNCLKQYGPDPSRCDRDASRDAECAN